MKSEISITDIQSKYSRLVRSHDAIETKASDLQSQLAKVTAERDSLAEAHTQKCDIAYGVVMVPESRAKKAEAELAEYQRKVCAWKKDHESQLAKVKSEKADMRSEAMGLEQAIGELHNAKADAVKHFNEQRERADKAESQLSTALARVAELEKAVDKVASKCAWCGTETTRIPCCDECIDLSDPDWASGLLTEWHNLYNAVANCLTPTAVGGGEEEVPK
jgi:chromosome segregation ATPase